MTGGSKRFQLGVRGKRLWRELTKNGPPDPIERVLWEEACRIADRLDILDRVIRGESSDWLVTQVDLRKNVLGEARQQALALRTILDKLTAGRAGKRPEPQGGSVIDQLAAARAARLANAASS